MATNSRYPFLFWPFANPLASLAPVLRVFRGASFAWFLVCAAAAQALVVAERDFSELVARADLILEGTVTRIEEAPDERGIQRTLVRLSDLLVHKGVPDSSEFMLDIAGGTKGGFRAEILDLPRFVVGDRVLLFVRGNGHAVFPVVGVHQGYFRVVPDDRGTPRVVRSDGLPVIGRSRRALRFPRKTSDTARAVPLDQFREWIRDELQRPAEAKEPE